MTRRKPYDWAEAEHCDIVSSGGLEYVRYVLGWLRYFLGALSRADLHAAISFPATCASCGTPWPATCATCQTPWPCLHARER